MTIILHPQNFALRSSGGVLDSRLTDPPVFTAAPTSVTLPSSGGTIQFSATNAASYSLPATRTGITINSATGLVTVGSAAVGTTGPITVRAANSAGQYTDTNCAVTVESQVVGFTPSASYGISGSFIDGGTITITGSGFTSKANAKPLLWVPFETSVQPHPTLSRTTSLNPHTLGYTPNIQSAIKPVGSVGAIKDRAATGSSLGRAGEPSSAAFFSSNPLAAPLTGENYVFVKRYYEHPTPENLKHMRLWGAYAGDSTATNGFYGYSSGNGSGGNWSGAHGENFVYGEANTDGSHYCGNMTFVQGQWVTDEFEFKTSSIDVMDGIYHWWQNARGAHTYGNRWAMRTTATPTAQKSIYLDQYTINNVGGGPALADNYHLYWNSLYVDDSRHRVFVSDEPSFNTGKKGDAGVSEYSREICIPTAWSDSSVTVVLRQGSHASLSGKYLYLVNGLGAVVKLGSFT